MGRRTFVIAEVGVNHNGSIDMADRLIEAAANCGADAVKFQSFRASRLAVRDAPMAAYQKGAGASQFEMLEALELSESDHVRLKDRCGASGVKFMSSGFDLESLDMLVRLGVDTVKIPSGELTNLPYLRRVGSLGLPVLLSTGMATLDEVEAAVRSLQRSADSSLELTLLHCTTEYPTPMNEVNLLAMTTLRDAFGYPVGLSDHTEGHVVAIAAVALGATVIEKHFTLDRDLPGPDHRASLDIDGLGAMISAIRRTEDALGDGVKSPSPSEVGNRSIVRKSIVAARDIRAGERLSRSNLTVKRPGTGLSPMIWDDVVGTAARRPFHRDEMIDL